MAEGRVGSGGPLVAVAAVAVTVLVLLLATWAATSGPDDPLRGAGPLPDPAPSVPTSATTSEPPESQGRDSGGGASGVTRLLAVAVGVVVIALLVLLGVGAVWVLVASLRSLARSRRPRHAPPEESSPPLGPAAAVAAAITADATTQLDLLAGGSPRNGIVQSWHRFEVQAARAGTPRLDWETSAEFTIRLLDLVEADVSSVGRLAALYREARFSDHEVGEDARTEAVRIVEGIHRDLRGGLTRSRR